MPLEPHIVLAGGKTVRAGTIYCIGRNYAEHAHELGNPLPAEPVVFLKAAASLRPLAEGPLAFPDEVLHHEAELVLLIGSAVPHGSVPTLAAVEAVGLGLDLTRREVQASLKARGLPWTTSKSFAGSAVVTRFVPRAADQDLRDVRFSLTVNDQLRQDGTTAAMLFPVPTILRFLARLAPLIPGDLIFTGTPAGVGPVRRGDRLRLAAKDLGIDETGTL